VDQRVTIFLGEGAYTAAKEMENSMSTELQVGDSVVVNPGTKDPDMGFDIAGCQGRVEDFYDDENTVLIR
jgi:hypothetical protein